MDTVVFAAVLMAALMHAGWNAVVKVGFDRFSSILLLAMVHSALALCLLPFFDPPAPSSWGWIAASALVHVGYKLFLIRAYEHGDLSQVYPLARGTAPVIVAITGALFVNEITSITTAAAILTIASGVIVMSMKGGTNLKAIPIKALAYAMGAAVFTASYTLIDGIGARLSGAPSGFALWMFVGDGMGMIVYALVWRGPGIFPKLLTAWRSGLAAGTMSLGSYWIAIWAFTEAPLAVVAALRESSVLFAMLIAVLVLKEPAGRWRWFAASFIASGVALMRI